MLSVRALPLLFVVGGCTVTTTSSTDFIIAKGQFADGTSVNVNLHASTGHVPSLEPGVGPVTAVGAPAFGPESLRGLRIEWQRAAIQANVDFASSPAGPVLFYVLGPPVDAGITDLSSALVPGGAITFHSTQATTTGVFSGLILTQNGQPLLTLNQGSFQATVP
jgi:hypothetical protein